MNKQLFKVCALGLTLAGFASLHAASNVNTSRHKEANFNSGSSLSPFELRNTTNGNYVKVVSKRLKMKWYEANYIGNRNTRSAEIWSTMSTYGDVYVGFKLYIPGTSGSEYFPSDKNTIIAQFMQRTNASGASTWAAVFEMNGNHLDFRYRGVNNTNHTVRRVKSNFPRGSWQEIIYHIRPGQTDGIARIWLNGNLVIDDRNARICWGSYSNTQKFGMYCADTAGYSNNEVRTIYMDAIGVYDGNSSGYSKVDP